VPKNLRLHGAFASDFESEMSQRYEAYAEHDVPRRAVDGTGWGWKGGKGWVRYE